MPNAYIKKLHKQGKGSIDKLEKKWKQAEHITKAKFKGAIKYGYLVNVFKGLVGIKEEVKVDFKQYEPTKKEKFKAKVKKILKMKKKKEEEESKYEKDRKRFTVA